MDLEKRGPLPQEPWPRLTKQEQKILDRLKREQRDNATLWLSQYSKLKDLGLSMEATMAKEACGLFFLFMAFQSALDVLMEVDVDQIGVKVAVLDRGIDGLRQKVKEHATDLGEGKTEGRFEMDGWNLQGVSAKVATAFFYERLGRPVYFIANKREDEEAGWYAFEIEWLVKPEVVNRIAKVSIGGMPETRNELAVVVEKVRGPKVE